MTKFRVPVHGRNYQILRMRKNGFLGREYSSVSVGFYTTRFIEAESANDALELVFALLKAELEADTRITKESIMELDEICEDESGYDNYAPGAGYTFYSSR